jgi:hypothetical protein
VASKQRTVDFVVEQMSEANDVPSRKMRLPLSGRTAIIGAGGLPLSA